MIGKRLVPLAIGVLIVTGPASSASRAQPTDRGLTPPLLREPAVEVPQLVRIPKATFMMGSPVTDIGSAAYRSAEKPQHSVTVGEFSIGRFLVTAEEFCIFLNEVGNAKYFLEEVHVSDYRTLRRSAGRYVPQVGGERCPAYPVTWIGAHRYCEWLAGKLNRPIRLPSEAEWALVARGVELRDWPWGNATPREVRADPPPWSLRGAGSGGRDNVQVKQYLPFYELCGLRWMHVPWKEEGTWMRAPVGSFPLNATPDGVYDMLGYYAGQWCADEYHERAHEEPRVSGPRARVDQQERRVLRGMYQVDIDYSTYRVTFPLLRLLIPGDAKWPLDTPGRSWSRTGEDPSTFGAMFRVAMSMEGPTDGSGRGN